MVLASKKYELAFPEIPETSNHMIAFYINSFFSSHFCYLISVKGKIKWQVNWKINYNRNEMYC